MIHDRNRTVAEAIERALRYAPAEAQSMVDRGQVFTAQAMLRTLGGKVYKQFVVARPWREGVPGFLRAGHSRCISLLRVGRLLAAFGREAHSGGRRPNATARVRGRDAADARPDRSPSGSAHQAGATRLTLQRRRRLPPSQSVAAKRSSESVPRISSRLRSRGRKQVGSCRGRFRTRRDTRPRRRPARPPGCRTR